MLPGLEKIKRISGHWGFQGKALASEVRVEASQPLVGLAALLEQPAFRKDQLPPIPAGVAGFVVASLKADQIYQGGVSLAKMLSPGSGEWVDKLESALDTATGVRLHQDVLGKLGPTWACFEDPDDADNKDDQGAARLVLLASAQDAQAFAKTLDTLATGINKAFREAAHGAGEPEPAQADIEFQPLPAPARGYVLTVPPGQVSLFTSALRPTVVVGNGYVAFALRPERAQRALLAETRKEARWVPSENLSTVFQKLPDSLTLLNVSSPRNSVVPGLVSGLPELVQIIATAFEIDESPDRNPGSELRALLNLPRPGALRVRFNDARRPTDDDIENQMFPSVLAAAVDPRGLRIISRQSLPLDNMGSANVVNYSVTKNIGQDAKFSAYVKFSASRSRDQRGAPGAGQSRR